MKNLILALIALFASSCGCGRINSAAAAAEGDGIECRDNDECDDGEECRDAKCVPVGELSCGDGEELKDGECVCVDEQACGGEPSEGEGEPAECEFDGDCADDQVCDDDGKCRDIALPPGGCTYDSDCPSGHTCNDAGDCVDTSPTPACQTDADCGSGQACTDDGDCVDVEPEPQGCVRDSECAAGKTCNDAGDCVDATPAPECDEDADCAADEVCDDGGECAQAVPPSGDDVLCVRFDQAVDVDQAGFFTGGDEALPADQDDVTQLCVTLDLAATGLAHFNLRINGDNLRYLAHNENNSRCVLDSALDRVTLNGSTVTVTALPVQCEDDPRGCTGPERVPTSGCDAWIGVEPDAVECLDDGDCTGTDVCNDDGQCIPVAPAPECVTDADCPGTDVCNDDGACVAPAAPAPECVDDGDCAGTDVCNDDGECVATSAAPECVFDAECGADERCNDAGDCVDATPPEPCVLDNECGIDQVCNDAGNCVAVTSGGPPPTGLAAAIIENASGKETVLEIRADQFPLCNSATGCSNADPEVFRKSAAHVVDLGGCMNQVLYSPEDEEETGIVDPINDLVSVVDGVFRIDFSLARFSCPGNQFARIFLVSTVHKDGSGRPNPDWDYRNVDWRTTSFNGVGSAFRETDPYTGFAIVEVELIYDADGNLLRIEPGA